ncbi:MAG: hypothetical protein KF824_01550 [Fimbriimonadaceae bacterium]|nr:MAG: hypothetical protein KF824_01550 [Fimbriimonadaceae bacterium]
MVRSTKSVVALTVAILAVLSVLVACGGSGSSAASGSEQTITGNIVVPGSPTLDLRISSGGSDSPVASNQFTISVVAGQFTTIAATDATTGKTILIGMRDPRNGSVSLDALNCARTLMFLTIGGSQLSQEDRLALWDAIVDSSEDETLADVISAEITTDPYALENGNTAIKTALDSAVAGLVAPIKLSTPPTNRGRAVEVPQFILTGEALPQNRRAQITPANDGVKFDNLFSKIEGSAFIYNVGYRDSDNATHNTTAEAVGGEIAFAPGTITEPVQLSIEGDHNAELFGVIALQPVFDAPEPAVFSNPDYAAVVPTWRASLSNMFRRGLVSVAGTTMLDAFGAPQVDLTKDSLSASATQLASVSGAAAVFIAADGGEGLSSLVSQLASIPAGDEEAAFATLAALAPLLQNSYPELAQRLANRNLTSAQIQGFRGTMRILSIMGSVQYSAQAGRIAADLQTGSRANFSRGVLAHIEFSITPPNNSEFTPNQSMLMTTNFSRDTIGPITYKWEILEGPGSATEVYLNDNAGHFGVSFTTSSKTCYLLSTQSTVGIAVVKVTVMYTDSDNTPQTDELEVRYTPVGHLEFHPITFSDSQFGANYYTIVSGDWIMKPPPVNGVYAAFQLNYTATISGHPEAALNGTYTATWNIPAWSGPVTPTVRDPRNQIPRASSGGTSLLGHAVHDYGDRLLIINHMGGGMNGDVGYQQFITAKIMEYANATRGRYTKN